MKKNTLYCISKSIISSFIVLGALFDSSGNWIFSVLQGTVLLIILSIPFRNINNSIKKSLFTETVSFIISAAINTAIVLIIMQNRDIYVSQLYIAGLPMLCAYIINILIILLSRKITGKALSSIALIAVCVSLTIEIIDLSTANIYPKNEKWDNAKGYYTIEIHDPTLIDNESQYIAGKKFKEFVSLCDEKDGIMMYPSNYYSDPEMYDEIVGDSMMFYDPNYKCTYINNNYLKKNPIYDLNSNAVNVPNNEIGITVLLPQKYSEYYDEIQQYYSEWYRWSYNIDEIVHQEYLTGDEISVEDYEYFPVNLIIVKDNQKYFTYSIDVGDENNNIEDPIAIIVNGINMGGDLFLAAITNNGYFINGKETISSISQQTDTAYQIGRIVPLYVFDQLFYCHLVFTLPQTILMAVLTIIIIIKCIKIKQSGINLS
ncbi:MAG: hypothetical protein IK990_14990 [Ruminiclostridium sp.]|nr:hypothetical protein [Ruminococcus sp.]MBP3856908.1 hypothetical protein [Ruminiclostridium sp.]